MIFTTHAIVGGAIASASGALPVGAFIAGMASHYLLDAIPHWDYSLSSKKSDDKKNGLSGDIHLNKKFIFDLIKISLDFFIGIFIAIWLFDPTVTASFSLSLLLSSPVLWGALGGVCPDALQFLYFKVRREPLIMLQRFHHFMHSSIRLNDRKILGPFLQLILIVAVVIVEGLF